MRVTKWLPTHHISHSSRKEVDCGAFFFMVLFVIRKEIFQLAPDCGTEEGQADRKSGKAVVGWRAAEGGMFLHTP